MSQTASPEEEAAGRRARTRRIIRLLAVAGAVLVLVATIGIAYGAGWGAANRAGNATRSHDVPVERVISIPDFGQAGASQMPDVRGLTVEEARQALSDAGINARITTQVRPAAGVPGVVIQQSPVFGAPNPAAVLLVVAEEATVPDIVGKPIQEAIDALQGMGVRVQQVKVYRPGATVGNVVSSTPGVGDPMTEAMVLEVADTPSEKRLVDLPTLQGWMSSDKDTTAVHGISYGSAIHFSPRWESPEDLIWDVSGAEVFLRSQFVLSENADTGERGTIEIRGDGNLIEQFPVTSTTAATLEVDLRGIDTLTIRVIDQVDPDSSDNAPRNVHVTLLDPVLLGSYEQMQWFNQ